MSEWAGCTRDTYVEKEHLAHLETGYWRLKTGD